MDLLLLSSGVSVETFNLPVIIGMVAAPLLLIGGAVWLALKMIKAKTDQ